MRAAVPNTDLKAGTTGGNADAKSLASCQSQCTANTMCTGFTYGSNRCYMTLSVIDTNRTAATNGLTAGVKGQCSQFNETTVSSIPPSFQDGNYCICSFDPHCLLPEQAAHG